MQFNEIVEFLKSVPDVVWSALIASLVTLSGVFLSNISNTNRLKLQLKHDLNEKAKERTLTLRREVALCTVEELVKANSHLSSLPNLDITKVNLADGLQGFFTAAARLQLVAEPKTSLLVNQLSADYSALVLKLMTDLIPVSKAKTDIEITDSYYQKTQEEISRILAEMRKINESDNPNLAALNSLQGSFQFEQEQAKEYGSERGDSWKRFNHYNVIFQKNLLIGLKEISSKQIAVIVEIRRDLGLTGDLAAIEEHMTKQWLRMETGIETLIAAIQENLEK